MHQILVLIPSYNELNNLKKFINKIPFPVLVGDDNSNDNTKIFLKKNKVNFFFNKKQLGYEKTLIKGFRIINKEFNKVKFIITMDADGQHVIKDVIKIAKIARSKKYDLIVGERNKFNRFSEKILSFLFYRKFKVKDPISGLKCYNAKILNKLLFSVKTNYFLVDIVKIFKKKKYLVKNTNISINKRKYDQPKIGNKLYANLKILKILILIF